MATMIATSDEVLVEMVEGEVLNGPSVTSEPTPKDQKR